MNNCGEENISTSHGSIINCLVLLLITAGLTHPGQEEARRDAGHDTEDKESPTTAQIISLPNANNNKRQNLDFRCFFSYSTLPCLFVYMLVSQLS